MTFKATAQARHRSRGFTLMELMAVVIIVGILAAIAIPTAHRSMRERRSANTAHEIADIYRMGRMRATGRGAAVLISFDKQNDTLTIREAVAGTSAPGRCAMAPVASCSPASNWDVATNFRQVDVYTPRHEGVTLYLFGQGAASVTDTSDSTDDTLDVCYTPSGRAFWRTGGAGEFAPLDFIPAVLVRMEDSAGNVMGVSRTVFVLPNGVARVGI